MLKQKQRQGHKKRKKVNESVAQKKRNAPMTRVFHFGNKVNVSIGWTLHYMKELSEDDQSNILGSLIKSYNNILKCQVKVNAHAAFTKLLNLETKPYFSKETMVVDESLDLEDQVLQVQAINKRRAVYSDCFKRSLKIYINA